MVVGCDACTIYKIIYSWWGYRSLRGLQAIDLIGRGDWIRTSDPLRPRQVRYQAALRPDSIP